MCVCMHVVLFTSDFVFVCLCVCVCMCRPEGRGPGVRSV